MVAEKTQEHDEHFVDGKEYVSYTNASEAAEAVHALCADTDRRRRLEAAGCARCKDSGYSTFVRAEWMIGQLRSSDPVK